MLETKAIDLERIGVVAMQTLSSSGIYPQSQKLSFEALDTALGKEIAVSFRAFVLGETLDESDYVFPAGWWEAIKERFAPAWLKRLYPVKTVSVRATVKALYPHLKAPQLEGHHKSVKIILLERGLTVHDAND